MCIRLLTIVLVLALVACAQKRVQPTVVRIIEPVEVKVPIPVVRVPPLELLAPLTPPLPMFVAPRPAFERHWSTSAARKWPADGDSPLGAVSPPETEVGVSSPATSSLIDGPAT